MNYLSGKSNKMRGVGKGYFRKNFKNGELRNIECWYL